jgi:hypothetical protein
MSGDALMVETNSLQLNQSRLALAQDNLPIKVLTQVKEHLIPPGTP